MNLQYYIAAEGVVVFGLWNEVSECVYCCSEGAQALLYCFMGVGTKKCLKPVPERVPHLPVFVVEWVRLIV